MTDPATGPVEHPARSRARSLIGFVIGLLLLAAAVWAVAAQRDELGTAWQAVRTAPAWMLAAAVALPVVNNVVIAGVFWVLTRRYGRVGPGEMTAVIGVAWLLNYLPLRPGMFGRIAYHKAVNGIRVADSVRVLFQNLACGGAASALALGIILGVAGSPRLAEPWVFSMLLGAPAAILVAGIVVPGRSLRRALAAGVLLRYVDLLVWGARYALVFALVGSPISLSGALAVAIVCQAALLVPFVGNGMGIREWAVGLTAAALPAAFLGIDAGRAAGLMADLVNRGAELMAAIPVGLGASLHLHRRRSATGDAARPRAYNR